MKLLMPGTAVLVMLVSSLAGAQTPPAAAAPKAAASPERAATETMLIANERKVNEAVAKGDKAAFLALVAPDAISADSAGFMPVKMFADALDQVKVTNWEITDPQVVWIDATSAVVAYTWTGAGTFQGQPFPPKAISSTVWTKKGGKWMAVFHQETAAAAK